MKMRQLTLKFKKAGYTAFIYIKASPGEGRGHKSRKHLIITLLNQLSALISMQNLPGKMGGKRSKHTSPLTIIHQEIKQPYKMTLNFYKPTQSF